MVDPTLSGEQRTCMRQFKAAGKLQETPGTNLRQRIYSGFLCVTHMRCVLVLFLLKLFFTGSFGQC